MSKKSKMISMTAQERKWRAQDDARTLSYATEIASDPKRLSAAQKEAAKMAKETEKAAMAMKKVAGKQGK